MLVGIVCIPECMSLSQEMSLGQERCVRTSPLCRGEGNSCFCIPPFTVAQLPSGLKYIFRSPLDKEVKKITLITLKTNSTASIFCVFIEKNIMP